MRCTRRAGWQHEELGALLEWFEVDRVGLGKLLERRGKEFVLYELLQNAWDQEVTRVDITLEKEPGSPLRDHPHRGR